MTSIVTRTLIIYISLTFVIRASGKRQVGQLDISEFVSTILLSEIASLPISDLDIPIMHAAVPIAFIICIEIIITFIKNKSPILKKVFESKSCILIDKGKLQPNALQKTRISVEELMGELRLKGAGDISEVYYAIIEHNGNISVILRNDSQPLTPKDATVQVEESGIDHALIVDGQINKKNIKNSGKNIDWLNKQLAQRHLSASDVFLMTVNDNNRIFISKSKKDKKT